VARRGIRVRPRAVAPFREARAAACVALLVAACVGGGDDGASGTSGTGAPAGFVTFEIAPGDPACLPDDAQILLRARKVGCIPPPPAPCTLPQTIPEIFGPAAACPTDAPTPLAVVVEEPGRYHVDLVHRASGGDDTYVCLEDAAGAALHDVTTDDLDAGRTFTLQPGAGPCPPP